jgi:glycosyltransferase involved in cell wall biosynthesis
MVRLAGGLAAAGHRVEILCLERDGALLDRLGNDVQLVSLSARSTVRAIAPLVRYLRGRRPKALIAAQPHLNLAATMAARLAGSGTALILTEHAPPSLEITFYGGWRYRALRWLVPLVYPMADRVVGVSRGICRELEELLPGRSIDLIYNPVLPANLSALASEPSPHPWLEDGGPPVIMGVGRLAAEKDFGILVRAVAAVRKTRQVRLMLLGEGAERESILAEAASLGLAEAIALPGRVDNVFAFLSRASVFVLSSRFEGFGNVLVEALACGAPVVATDCPVGPREILDGGQFGCLVPPGDISAMATAIESALAFRTPPLPDHVRRFTVEASVACYEALIDVAVSARALGKHAVVAR